MMNALKRAIALRLSMMFACCRPSFSGRALMKTPPTAGPRGRAGSGAAGHLGFAASEGDGRCRSAQAAARAHGGTDHRSPPWLLCCLLPRCYWLSVLQVL